MKTLNNNNNNNNKETNNHIGVDLFDYIHTYL